MTAERGCPSRAAVAARDLARLVLAARRAGEEAAPALGGRASTSGAASVAASGRAGGPSGTPLWTGSLHVVPVPSTPAARRRRGAAGAGLHAGGGTEGGSGAGSRAGSARRRRRAAGVDGTG